MNKSNILINNNVHENGILINDNSKVDFTIGNNQLCDNNINNVGTSKSFFRMDSTYGPRSYDKSNKVQINQIMKLYIRKKAFLINNWSSREGIHWRNVRLVNSWTYKSDLETIALQAWMTVWFITYKTSLNSKSKENSQILKRR